MAALSAGMGRIASAVMIKLGKPGRDNRVLQGRASALSYILIHGLFANGILSREKVMFNDGLVSSTHSSMQYALARGECFGPTDVVLCLGTPLARHPSGAEALPQHFAVFHRPIMFCD